MPTERSRSPANRQLLSLAESVRVWISNPYPTRPGGPVRRRTWWSTAVPRLPARTFPQARDIRQEPYAQDQRGRRALSRLPVASEQPCEPTSTTQYREAAHDDAETILSPAAGRARTSGQFAFNVGSFELSRGNPPLHGARG